LLILEHVLKNDPAFHRVAGYAISDMNPFILFINWDKEPAAETSASKSIGSGISTTQQRNNGTEPGPLGENARLISWMIRGVMVGKDNLQPAPISVDSRMNMNTSGLRMLLETAEVRTEGWLLMDKLRFELEKSVISYHDRKSPGKYSEGSVIIINGIRSVLSAGNWVVLL